MNRIINLALILQLFVSDFSLAAEGHLQRKEMSSEIFKKEEQQDLERKTKICCIATTLGMGVYPVVAYSITRCVWTYLSPNSIGLWGIPNDPVYCVLFTFLLFSPMVVIPSLALGAWTGCTSYKLLDKLPCGQSKRE